MRFCSTYKMARIIEIDDILRKILTNFVLAEKCIVTFGRCSGVLMFEFSRAFRKIKTKEKIKTNSSLFSNSLSFFLKHLCHLSTTIM